MSNQISLLKARYCQSILNTASISPDAEARNLIDGLTTETPTPGTDESVANAEADAIEAIQLLADQWSTHPVSFGSSEWQQAKQAVARWVIACS